MHRLIIVSLLLALSGGAGAAQVVQDPFDYTPGTKVGDWIEHLADWMALGTKVRAPVGSLATGYMTRPSLTLRDCVVEVTVEYNPAGNNAQYAGVTLRANAPSTRPDGRDLLTVSASGAGQFNYLSIQEISPTGWFSGTRRKVSAFRAGRVRAAVIDNRLVARIDTDNDGRFDDTLTRTISLRVLAGPVGTYGLGAAFLDDFRLFDAVLLDALGTPPPRPGNEYRMVLRGRPGAAYQAATSLSNAGIPLGDGRAVPLGLDAILLMSATNVVPGLFKNYSGRLDGNGDGRISIALPGLPALTGVTLYTAFVNVSGGRILNISNDHQVTIQ